ncbi:MAG: preprotein translocase subunit SecG [Phycisphaerales bacterium]
MSILTTILMMLFIVCSVALILIILVQRPQGGGLSAAFGGGGGGGSQSAFGAKTGDVLTIATVAIFIAFLLIAVFLVKAIDAQFMPASMIPPLDPTGLAVSQTGPDSVTITWIDESDDETEFRVQRSADQQTWTEVGRVDADTTTFTDSGLTPESRLYYRVFAMNDGGPSEATEIIEATTTAAPELDVDPSDAEDPLESPVVDESEVETPVEEDPLVPAETPETPPADDQPESGDGAGDGGGR